MITTRLQFTVKLVEGILERNLSLRELLYLASQSAEDLRSTRGWLMSTPIEEIRVLLRRNTGDDVTGEMAVSTLGALGTQKITELFSALYPSSKPPKSVKTMLKKIEVLFKDGTPPWFLPDSVIKYEGGEALVSSLFNTPTNTLKGFYFRKMGRKPGRMSKEKMIQRMMEADKK